MQTKIDAGNRPLVLTPTKIGSPSEVEKFRPVRLTTTTTGDHKFGALNFVIYKFVTAYKSGSANNNGVANSAL